MYRPYVLQGTVMIVIGFFIFFLFELPNALSGYQYGDYFKSYIVVYGSFLLVGIGAYRIYEGFK